MIKILLLLFIAMALTCFGYGQSLHLSREQSSTVVSDILQLEKQIDSLNKKVLTPIITKFDTCKGFSNPLFDSVGKKYADSIRASIDNIKKDSFYLSPLDTTNSAPSYLYFYTNKELDDYMTSTFLFQNALLELASENQLNPFGDNYFLNAYHYMSLTRSLLLARLDFIGNVLRFDKLFTLTQNINNTTTKIDSLLNKPFTPYFLDTTLKKKKVNMKSLTNKGDKITTAGNAILYDNRRNWWHGLLAGLGGGLLAGLLVALIHKN